jgi:hypothetical protein
MEGVITTVAKNPLEEIRISRRTYKTFEFIDIRLFYQDDDGTWRPTKHGITVGLDQWDEFKAAIAQVTLDDTTAPRPRRRR